MSRSFCSFVPGNARKLYLSNRSIRSMVGNDPVRRNSSWVETNSQACSFLSEFISLQSFGGHLVWASPILKLTIVSAHSRLAGGTAGIQPIVNMSFACLVVLSPFIVELAMVVVLLLDAVGVLWIGRIGDSAWFSTAIDGWQGEVMMGLADCTYVVLLVVNSKDSCFSLFVINISCMLTIFAMS